ncbi:nucleotidyltransferase domain-containing protein [Paenibacillus sp. HB172176]|uniref:nucleotidyltransferase family protein n=1 Tax=Paenibacillus sp. HB172176 TaxID=2493690 RepID=UPI001439E654|nr:nucleotidyltransferase domain-containing protein [Paenibacillus sp. HB172176]
MVFSCLCNECLRRREHPEEGAAYILRSNAYIGFAACGWYDRGVILFGSKARGDFEEYSDIDLVFLTEKQKSAHDRFLLSDLSAEMSIENDVLLSCLFFNENDWLMGNEINPLLKANVDREGVEIEL